MPDRVRAGAGEPESVEAPRKVDGFIHRPGVVWIGQSVLVLPTRDAEELAARLRSMSVRVSMARVPIGAAALEAFRRRGVL